MARWTCTTRSMQSCDVYFYRLANTLGIERIHDFLRAFGFGQPTGIDIAGERSGILPSPEWKKGALQAPGRPGLVPRRDRDRRHRPGLLTRHAAAARAHGDRDPRDARHSPTSRGWCSALRESGDRRGRADRSREALPRIERQAPGELGDHRQRDGRGDERPRGTAPRSRPRRARTRSPARPARRRCSRSARTRSTTRRTSPSACATTRCSSRSRRRKRRRSRSRCWSRTAASAPRPRAPIARADLRRLPAAPNPRPTAPARMIDERARRPRRHAQRTVTGMARAAAARCSSTACCSSALIAVSAVRPRRALQRRGREHVAHGCSQLARIGIGFMLLVCWRRCRPFPAHARAGRSTLIGAHAARDRRDRRATSARARSAGSTSASSASSRRRS